MYIINARMSRPTQKDVKYLNDRIASRFKAKQILPTLWVTFETFDAQGDYITSDSICEDLANAEDKISVIMYYFVTKGDRNDTEFDLPPNASDLLEKQGL